MHRRTILAAAPSLALLPRAASAASDFNGFLAGLRNRARAAGIPDSVISQTTSGLVPNADVLRLDQHQPEFTLTWAQYSSKVVNQARIQAGQAKYGQARNLLAAITSRFGVGAIPLMGIWGIETNFGVTQGSFNVIDALTTLAWDRGSSYFAGQVISAMHIIANGDAPASRLIGSYAGAMGQPQFMPGVYLSTAISYTGNGRPNIWGSDADTLASMGNYLAKAGWQPGLPSSEQVLAPPNINVATTGRDNVQTVGYWRRLGVRALPGGPRMSDATPAALLLPDGAGGQAFLIFANFKVIRRYNASDYYALAVDAVGRLSRS